MDWKTLIREWPGEEVVVRYDREADAWMFIAIHAVRGKRSVGGVRMKTYPSPEDGLLDALRLAEGMTYKWAAIDVEYGGGKAVIALSRPVQGDARTALLLRFAGMIDSLNGRYGSGPDIGTTPADMGLLATRTRYVHCYDWKRREPYDPGIYTALGVFIGMKAALRHATGSDALAGRRVLIQGVGDTGAPLARSVAAEGGLVLLNDLDQSRAERLAAELKGEVVPVDRVYDTPCDAYAPCSVGATLNEDTIPRLRCTVVTGSANNQLATPEDAERLHARGILYAPDYVVNGAGAVSLALVDEGVDFETIRREIGKMDRRMTEIFEEAAARNESPVHAARRRVERRAGVRGKGKGAGKRERERERHIDTNPVNRLAVEAILSAFREYRSEFRAITRRTRDRFLARDWAGMHEEAEARLAVYGRRVADVVVRLGQLSQWQPVKPELTLKRYAGLVEEDPASDLARTFYNSAIRRLLGTVGADPRTEFLDFEPAVLDGRDGVVTAAFGSEAELGRVLEQALGCCGPPERWHALPADAQSAAGRLVATLPELARGGQLTWVPEPFLRGPRAFAVGRLDTPVRSVPLVLPIVHGANGLTVDAVITSGDEASMVFGFTRTYFQVDLDAPRRVVAFLRSLLPGKRIDELYTVLGYHKHGKREFYQALVRTLRQPGARFERAEGVRGMVMVVFALRPMNVVFKVIKDRADPPKTVTRREVVEKYRFVFGQEYGGRLADTQEFEDLSLPRAAFPAEVRDSLTQAAETVRESGDWLVFEHLYTERRMTPLDLYLRHAPAEQAEQAVIDFGRAIKELAGINVFPGDMLAKNFGVTRHGRVVFYDYDEIGPLDACSFRRIPPSTTVEEEMAAEPWFSVREGDVFPEEFERFVRLPGPLHEVFLTHHGDLFTPEYWNDARRRVLTEGISEPAPYPRERRLRREADGASS